VKTTTITYAFTRQKKKILILSLDGLTQISTRMMKSLFSLSITLVCFSYFLKIFIFVKGLRFSKQEYK